MLFLTNVGFFVCGKFPRQHHYEFEILQCVCFLLTLSLFMFVIYNSYFHNIVFAILFIFYFLQLLHYTKMHSSLL
jgi:hypothetical protein